MFWRCFCIQLVNFLLPLILLAKSGKNMLPNQVIKFILLIIGDENEPDYLPQITDKKIKLALQSS